VILKTKLAKDDLVDRAYRWAMRELGDFYNIKWTHHTPNIIVVDDRKTIDALRKEKTEPWLVGWTDKSQNFHVLNFKKFGKESSHRYSREHYEALIKHELSHLFVDILTGGQHNFRPVWLNEGIALYTAGQNKFRRKPLKFHEFLAFYDHGGAGVYQESGFFVEMLVKKFGKEKLFRLIRATKKAPSKKAFDAKFKIYSASRSATKRLTTSASTNKMLRHFCRSALFQPFI
jgi:hypothetical protein